MTITPDRVSSPASTGGAGTFFEQHVGAYWLAQLLLRSIPPILIDCAVEEVCLQTEHLGRNTDDFLIVGQRVAGGQRKLLGQVKRTFTVSASDADCKKAILDFWRDFGNDALFAKGSDRLVLVTFRGTDVLLEHFSGLLDCARAARDAAEFEHFLATPGRVSGKSVAYCEAIGTILSEGEGRAISRTDLWPFLRVLHVLSLDLASSTGQAESAVKSMLAHATSGQDAVGAAGATWDALLRLVGEGMPQSRSLKRSDLPEELRQRHAEIEGADQTVLRRLTEHSASILGNIRATIGDGLRLGRDKLVQHVLDCSRSSQAVLVSGAAGSGKSCVAKIALGLVGADHFTFCFRAEELASPHLDTTLGRIQAQATEAKLRAVMACQGTKVLLIESVERLLEKDTREAFNDLLGMVSQDAGWRLILTCRDYSAETVRSALLDGRGMSHATISVPQLDDAELDLVQAAFPALARPLADRSLRPVLSNPYVLDKALRIPWSDGRPLPRNEREFRELFWKAIIRVDDRAAEGMPRRREQAFVEIALRRARALSPYAAIDGIDPGAVAALRGDSLLTPSERSEDLLAPAHDVLEDWAILQWIDKRHAQHADSASAFSAEIGAHPAVRRTYRTWVAELVEREPLAADALFQSVVRGEAGTPQFNDDTIVSLLRSSLSGPFLDKHTHALFENGGRLFGRIVRLLRVACVTTPAWLKLPETSVTWLVPDGPAWASVLGIARARLASFAEGDRPLLLGLVEDWARSVSWQNPHPDGAADAAAIAHWLLPAFDDYQSEDLLKRTLQVIVKVPAADPAAFASLLLRSDEERDGRADDEVRTIVLEGIDGNMAARDVPDNVIAAARDYLLCSEADVRGERSYGGSHEIEPLFGIKSSRSHGFFPASAYRGPFLSLLRHHPGKGLAFIVEVFGHSAEWYAHPRVRVEFVEEPSEISLTFGDGTSRKQWCNQRLWCLYRGTTVGPYVLQSLLMALERWLKELAETSPKGLDRVLLHILRHSQSGALTAVVASIAAAHPHDAGESLLVLLRSPECVRLDRRRLAGESQSPSLFMGFLPQLGAMGRVFDAERREADAWPHRRVDLETAVLNLQLGEFRRQAQDILDQHRAAMPPKEQWDEEDRIWSLALDRMDLRRYAATEIDAPATPAGNGHKLIRLDLNISEPEVRKMADESAADTQVRNARYGLFTWGMNAFSREETARHTIDQWKHMLHEARASAAGDDAEDRDPGRDAPGFIAAVCVRDHWDDMSSDERDWCVSTICSEVCRNSDRWNHIERVQRSSMSADRPCAWVLPQLLSKTLTGAQLDAVRSSFVAGLTHAIREVRGYVTSGIGSSGLVLVDRELALRCVNAIVVETTAVRLAMEEDRRRPHEERRQVDEIEAEAATATRRVFWAGTAVTGDAYQAMDVTTWAGAEANRKILAILGQAPAEGVAIGAFERLARTLVGWWDADKTRRNDRNRPQRERHYEAEYALSLLLVGFCLKTSTANALKILQPIVDSVDRHPKDSHKVLQGFIEAEDRQHVPLLFWPIWEAFADKARIARWLPRIDEEHAKGQDIISALFLAETQWKEETRHWRSLDGNTQRIHALFEGLPPSATALRGYVSFLYHVGEQSFPAAFVRLSRRVREGGAGLLAGDRNATFMLESLLQRYVYGRPQDLKRATDLRESVLSILDLLVENGSSAAFRMRDDFVTPASTAA